MTRTPFAIRPPTPADAAPIAEVYIRTRHAAEPRIPPMVHDAREVREWIARIVLPHRDVSVAEVDGRIVAMMALDAESVEHLYVLPELQRGGIGEALLALAKQRRAHLRLRTLASNHPARAFYEKRGFLGVEFGDGSGNEEHAPDVGYEWNALRPVSLDEIESLATGAWILG